MRHPVRIREKRIGIRIGRSDHHQPKKDHDSFAEKGGVGGNGAPGRIRMTDNLLALRVP